MALHTLVFSSIPKDLENNQQLPRSISSVLVHGRRYNKEQGIRAVLCFYRGQYIHIAEGERRALFALLEHIRCAPQHESVQLLIDSPAEQKLLERNNLRLLSGTEASLTLQRYLEHYTNKRFPLNTPVDTMLQSIPAQPAPQTPRWMADNQNIRLDHWPVFNRQMPSRNLLELCALLSRHAISYHDLLKQNPFDSEQKLKQQLNNLYAQSLLIFEQPSVKTLAPRGRFFAAIRQLINRPLSNA